MPDVKISLINGDLLETPSSLAFLKHIENQMSMPEEAVDARIGGRLTSLYEAGEKPPYIQMDTEKLFAFPKLYILNFYDVDLPFTYSSLDSYARRLIRHALKDSSVTSIATAIHGPGCGLDVSESLETILSALHRELQLRGDFANIQEIMLVEKDKKVFNRLRERVSYILDNKTFIKRRGRELFLSAEAGEFLETKEERLEELSKHLFVAMPYAKEFNNIYYFGIKGTVEKRKLKCERVDQDNFTGDIVNRIKERIASAEVIIADITNNKPNVFYEVGYADGLKKKIIFISQMQEIPFDISTQRQIFYDPEDILSLAKELGEFLDSILADE
jgi:hypothetical protein